MITIPEAIGRDRLVRLARWGATMSGASAMNLLCAFAVMILTVRYLGASQLGVLTLITTIYYLVGKVVSLETWQAVVKLGADAQHDAEPGRLARIIAVGFVLDVLSAVVAAGVALGALAILGPQVGISPEIMPVASLVALVLATRIFGTPSGILRLTGKFGLTAWIQIGEAVSRLAGVIVLVWLGASFDAFVVTYAVVFLASNLALLVAAMVILRRERMMAGVGSLRGAVAENMRSVFRYSLGTSLVTSLGQLQNHLGTLFVGLFLNTESVGIFHVTSRIAMVIGILARPIPIVLFPDLAELAAKRDYGTMLRLLALGVAVCAIGGAAYTGFFVLVGPAALELIAGAEFVSGHAVLILLLIAQSIILLGFAPAQFLLACAGPGRLLVAKVIAISVFCLATPVSLMMWGLEGAGIGLLVNGLTLVGASTLAGWLWLRPRMNRPPPSSVASTA